MKFVFIFCVFVVFIETANSQKIRAIDNKGTIHELFVPSVVERFPDADQTVVEAATFTTINFQDQSFAPEAADYTTDDDGITVLNEGRYKVTCRISSEVLNNGRVGGEFHLTLNNGTINVVANSKVFSYQRNNLVDKNTVTIVKILDLDANDEIGVEGRVYASSRNTNDALTILMEGTSLIIEKVD